MSAIEAAIGSAISKIRPLFTHVSRREWVSRVVILLLGALCMRVCLLGSLSPFGPALFAAAWSLSYSPLFVLLGITLGAISAPLSVLPGYCGAILFFIAASIFSAARKRIGKSELLLIFLLSQCAMIPIFRTASLYEAFMGTLETLLAFVLYFVFHRALALGRPNMRYSLAEEEFLGLCVLSGAVILGLSNLKIYDFSLSAIVAVAMTLLAGFFGGAAIGTAAAVSMGLTLTAGGTELAFVGTLAACGLAAGALRRLTRVGVALGFILCEAIVLFYTGSAALPLRDALLGAAIFLFLPSRLISPIGRMLDASRRREYRERSAQKRIRTHIEERLSGIADVFHDMAKLFPQTESVRAARFEVDEIVARCACGICEGCLHLNRCWHGKNDTSDILLTALDAYRRNGSVRRPDEMLQCDRLDSLMQVLDLSFDEYLSRLNAQSRAVESQGFLGRQMDSVANVVDNLASHLALDVRFDESMEHIIYQRLNELGMHSREVSVQVVGITTEAHIVFQGRDDKQTRQKLKDAVARASARRMRLRHVAKQAGDKNTYEAVFTDSADYEVEIGKAAKTKPGSSACGDSFGIQQLSDGRKLVVLSDGMGSGEAAARESRATVSLFTGLYAAGFDRESVLETINKLLILRGGETYATVDAVLINQTNGKAEFIKFGAAPSVLVKEGRNIRIASESLPIGIVEAAKPEVFMRMLSENDQIVMMSDGVWDALPDDGELIQSCLRLPTAQEAADRLLFASGRMDIEPDDKSVIVIRLKHVNSNKKSA